jgi:hypothetical protein
MADLNDVRDLDWGAPELPEDFRPLEAMVLIKGVYLTDDGGMTRPTWCLRWTEALARNQAERIGALQIAARLAIDEAAENYDDTPGSGDG